MKLDNVNMLINKIIEFCVNYSFRVIGAVIILILGFFVARWISKIILRLLQKKNIDITLSKFIVNVVKLLIIVFAVIISLGKFGITIAPFIAAIGAGAFGLTYAIQGPLSNYGAGIALIIGRPFKVGDTITVAGVSGIVEEIKLGSTTLKNEDSVRITIPNKHIVGEILHNSEQYKIVEGSIGISYTSDTNKAIELISNILKKHESINQQNSPQIGIEKFADSSINIGYRYWVKTMEFFDTMYLVNKEIFKIFKKEGMEIPFPQRVIYIKENNYKN